MKSRFGRAFRVFTVLLLGLTAWTVYANVVSDDTELRARAGTVAREQAGCGEKCKVTGIHGSRGMLDESIAYDIDGSPGLVVTCRRQYVVVGDYTCEATKR